MQLTEQEQAVMDNLVSAWNAFCDLPVEHNSDTPEFLAGIHRLQEKILSRPTRRALQE